MDVRNSTILESSSEDSILFETVKSIAKGEDRKETENEEDFFLMSLQEKQYSSANVKEAATTYKRQTEEMFQWTDLCRICANANDHLIPIFEGEGAELDLSSKIFKYLPIHVSKNDTLPLQLCYHCAVTLLAWHQLSKDCLNAEKKLLEIQDVLQNKQQNDDAASFINSDVSIPVISTISTVSNIAISPIDRQTDCRNSTHDTEGNVSNRSCGVQTPFRVFLDTQNVFWKPYRKPRAEPAHVVSPPNAAKYCDSVWIAMMNTSLDQPAELSAEQPQNNNPLRSPVEAEEGPPPSPTEDSKRKRKQLNSSKSHKQCAECGRCFKLKDSYQRHMRIHKDERPFTCHVCGKQFRDSGGLSRHLKDVHAKLKNFTCDLCDRSFASKATREDHRRTHTGERPYVCDSCGKTFKSKASLYIHSKLHTDEFPHTCSYCTKRFRRRQEMLAHVTTHTGEKNHTCDVCGKKFRIKSELARHKLIHSENKPFSCSKCGLAFRQRRYLNNHIKSRHNEPLQRVC
ncbi:PREDICTED: zinc finger protein 260-like isoform X2 [Dinoponera quadriceps]|uniref:Zinc finger protein 260-like isoform X2 n=1 Tax=Dinoponera quadriceps TaxID=609295 RepID=A0A6P3XUP1_DINQU|nr:PREDICTED: zinc finger protein 260-like isoform X2 [Dinoponera quadriceps]